MTETKRRRDRVDDLARSLLGQLDATRDDWPDAVTEFERAAELYRTEGSRNALVVQAHLGVAEIGAGDHDSAERRFRDLVDRFETTQFSSRLSIVYLGLAACAAHNGNWNDWRRHLDDARIYLDRHPTRYDDHRRLADWTADLAESTGADDAAREMRELADDLRDDLRPQ